MGYAERILQPGETVAYRARLHWVVMAPGIAMAVLSVVLGLWAVIGVEGHLRDGLLSLCGLLFLAGGVGLIAGWLRQVSTEIILTDRRIILKTGLVSRNSLEMNLDKVESVLVRQTIFGRLLDFGAIIIRGVGAGLEPVMNVAAPLEFHRRLNAGR